uniref:Equatorin, sperm acrosome associated n=1 Tax=Nannospalax galili TaxID=1026970 RepID=A0A8C6WD59_NANGA
MDFVMFVFLSGFLLPGVTFKISHNYKPIIHTTEDSEENPPANEKTGNYYKDITQYVFTTQNTNGTDSEISVKATTDLRFALKNCKYQRPDFTYYIPLYTRNFTTCCLPLHQLIVLTAINGTAVRLDDKDQLFQAIPGSDLNTTNEDKLSKLEEIKLKLMLGISLMTFILSVPLLIFCFATLYKLRHLSDKNYESQYTINPELATLSYFHPSEGSADTGLNEEPNFLPREEPFLAPEEELNVGDLEDLG